MIRIVISEVAARSIVEQSDYYYEQSGKELAVHWEKEVADTLLSLQAFPERGAKHS